MKFIKELWNRLRGVDIKAAEAIKDPTTNATLAIADAKDRSEGFREKLRNALAQKKLMEGKLSEAEGDIKKYDNIAKLALKATNEADAKEAIKQKLFFTQRANTLRSEIQKADQVITTQRQELEKYDNKIETAENNKEILEVRLEGASLREDMSKAKLGDVAGLDSLENAVKQAEARADATEELNGGKVDLEEKYSGVDSNIDSEYQRMKNELQPS